MFVAFTEKDLYMSRCIQFNCMLLLKGQLYCFGETQSLERGETDESQTI